MREDIYKSVWELSPRIRDSASYKALTDLTQQLIDVYESQGRLEDNPFNSTRLRKLSLPLSEVNRLLKDSTCLVTGGLGCVGSALLRELVTFDVKCIVVLDIRPVNDSARSADRRVRYIQGDIRSAEVVEDVFSIYEPDYVFHTAAQRDPGYAEKYITDTVTTNVFGTLNVVRASERSGTVKQFVFSSTGKASRYFTEEIYACTKKICEFIVDTYAKSGNVRYTMVRFTHILDNSLMNAQLENGAQRDDWLAVHCPGKYVTAQNVKEAAYLMLNALIYSEDKQCNFLLVRNLEWPVESLEMALFYIKQSRRPIPVIFMGNPLGYTEKFFRGQMDWSNPTELNLLINVYEQQYRWFNAESDIIISRLCDTSKDIVEKVLRALENVSGESETRECLVEGLKEIVKDSLRSVNKADTVNILNWGIQQKYLDIEKAKVSDYGCIIPMMFESLEGTIYYSQVENLICQKV